MQRMRGGGRGAARVCAGVASMRGVQYAGLLSSCLCSHPPRVVGVQGPTALEGGPPSSLPLHGRAASFVLGYAPCARSCTHAPAPARSPVPPDIAKQVPTKLHVAQLTVRFVTQQQAVHGGQKGRQGEAQ